VSGTVMDAFEDPILGYIWGLRSVLVVAAICPFFLISALIIEQKKVHEK
jgi:hypothetical protein